MILGLGRLILEKNRQKRDYLGIFSLKGGGGPLFPNVYVRILTKSEHFCKNQKCSLGPKTQNKPSIFFLNGGLPNRGGGGGVRYLGKTPNKSRIFFLTGSLIIIVICVIFISRQLNLNLSVCSKQCNSHLERCSSSLDRA